MRDPDLVNLAGVDTGREHLSHTALNALIGCEQRWHLHYGQRLDPNVKSVALDMGAAFALALKMGDPDTGAADLTVRRDEAERAYGADPWTVVPTAEQTAIDATIVESAAAAYLDRYGADGIHREHEMKVRLRNPEGRVSRTFDLLGIVDAVSDDYRTIIEDKLVTQVPKDLGQHVRLDRQVSIEAYLVWRTTGVQVDTIKYRVTRKPAIRPRQNETHSEFLDRIREEYATRPDHYLREVEANRSLEDFELLEAELWEWADRVRRARRSGVFPRNTSACHDYGGCRYLPLCSREPGAEHQFHVRPKRDLVAA